MGLPHRNSSVFKQTPYQLMESKKKRPTQRIREGDNGGGGLTGTRASEAKGPFPGGKRVGSWGKKSKSKSKSKSKRKQKRKPLALAQKLYEDNCLRIREIFATKVKRTLALHPL